MPPDAAIWLALSFAGALLVALGRVLLMRAGVRIGMARRLGGAREWKVADLLDATSLPVRPIRVAGRIRCADPLQAPSGERLVAYHRDIDVRFASGRWRTIERLRESRSFELWDHGGSLTIDPASAAEPLITIPYVWRGAPGELGEGHRAAVERLSTREGPATEARSTTRTISVVDRLLVFGRPLRADGRIDLAPPKGGYVISSVPLDAAMRLLAGRRRRAMGIALGVMAAGGLLVATGLVAALITSLA